MRIRRGIAVLTLALGALAGWSFAQEPEGGQGPAGQPEAPEPQDANANAADDVPDKPQLAPEVAEVLAKLDEANRDIKDATARLTYEESIPLLETTKRSRGRLTFKKPNRIIMKLGKPHREDVYTDGKLWWVVSHEDKQVQVFHAAGPDEGTQEAAFLNFGYGSAFEELARDYKIELADRREAEDGQETVYRLRFVPKERPGRPAHYQAVEVEVSDRRWLPSVLVLEEVGGEIVHTYRLQDIKTNTGVEDGAFRYEPPRGYAVVKPQDF